MKAPTDRSHIAFIKKIRKHCGRYGVFIEFSPSKSLNSGDGDRVLGYFQPPYRGELGLIRIATGDGWQKACYTASHEYSHFLSWLKNPKTWLRRVMSDRLDHYVKEEIFAESNGLKLLKKNKVKVDYRKVKPAVKRYIRDIRALRY